MKVNSKKYQVGFIIAVVASIVLLIHDKAQLVDAQGSSFNQTTATLSEARDGLAATSSGELVFFGGGFNGTITDRVDICNATNVTWTTATLSVPRQDLAAASSGSLVFFAGGWNGSSTYSNTVDIYNVSDGSWSTETLSQARYALAATSVGCLVLFGGGYNGTVLNAVDIYNVTSNMWTTTTLSAARYEHAAISVASRYALFAGGYYNSTNASNVVDIFDSVSGMWNTTTFSQARGDLAAASLGNLAFFGGGHNGSQAVSIVDIFNATSQSWSTATLSKERYYLAAAAFGDIVTFGGGTADRQTSLSVIDIYNVTTNMWSNATLSQPRHALVATSTSASTSTSILTSSAGSLRAIFFGGGLNNNSSNYSNVVDIFEIPFAVLSASSPYAVTPLQSTSPFVNSSQTPATSTNSPTPPKSPMAFSFSTSLPSNSRNASQTNSNMIVGIVLGAIALTVAIGIILFLVLFIKRRAQTQKRRKNNENNPLTEQTKNANVTESDTNSVPMEETNAAIISTYQPGEETMKSLSPGQISLNELEIGNEIGQGTYGRVCVGKWKKYRVALKFCQSSGKMEEFLREANLMISLPPHPNVVRMYGISIDGNQPIIVMEYCAGGSLDKLLFDERAEISMEQKIEWVREIAEGMCHLHKYNIVHRDLAARNILLSQPYPKNTHLKISDFGMSRVLQQDIEGKTMNPVGPLRWMAPESLSKQVYSKKSDVWMFGILIYEIVAQCEPHTKIAPNDLLTLIRDKGMTPTIPSNCPVELRQLMEICWNKHPEQRPTFENICEYLDKEK